MPITCGYVMVPKEWISNGALRNDAINVCMHACGRKPWATDWFQGCEHVQCGKKDKKNALVIVAMNS